LIYTPQTVPGGFDVRCDVVVVGSGAGGAVAALNLVDAGMKVVVIEAGPELVNKNMTRNAPEFLTKYLWDSGMRFVRGNAYHPTMQGKVIGGSTKINSAIMFKLHEEIKNQWAEKDGLCFLKNNLIDASFKRIFKKTSVSRTPMAVMGKRNLIVRDVLKKIGLKGKPLLRAVKNCDGCGDCLTGCFKDKKQSVDRTYLKDALAKGISIFSCCQVTEILTKGNKVCGVKGYMIRQNNNKNNKFRISAPLVILAAGCANTPVILLNSKITAGKTVGKSFYAHIGGAAVGFMKELVNPWIGATQGWGAFDSKIPGLKYESLWAPESLITGKWGGFGAGLLKQLPDLKHAVVISVLYKGNVTGCIKAASGFSPDMKLKIPKTEIHVIMRALKQVCHGFLKCGAKYIFTGVRGVKDEIRTADDCEALLNPKIDARSYTMTLNHIFGSCPMGANRNTSSVHLSGKVRGVEGLYICDASIFPGPCGVNPQATVMALSDLITRRLGEFRKSDYLAGG
jgi:choline dehydrogenase-like flavoprotein